MKYTKCFIVLGLESCILSGLSKSVSVWIFSFSIQIVHVLLSWVKDLGLLTSSNEKLLEDLSKKGCLNF
jgi:hypothetical protein